MRRPSPLVVEFRIGDEGGGPGEDLLEAFQGVVPPPQGVAGGAEDVPGDGVVRAENQRPLQSFRSLFVVFEPFEREPEFCPGCGEVRVGAHSTAKGRDGVVDASAPKEVDSLVVGLAGLHVLRWRRGGRRHSVPMNTAKRISQC
jgi:hypothetical protein